MYKCIIHNTCQQLHTYIYIHNNKYIYNTHIIDSTQHIPTYTPLKQQQNIFKTYKYI